MGSLILRSPIGICRSLALIRLGKGVLRLGIVEAWSSPVHSDRVPAYLEATTPRNRSLYERLGFEQIGTIQVGSSPPIFPMTRKPR